ncbi:MAG: formylglycine-generating enzyme family protein [Cyanobacteria bacterium P01_F01_bin.86]
MSLKVEIGTLPNFPTALEYIEILGIDQGYEIALEMVPVPGGTFLMGSPEDEPEGLASERPQHPVGLRPFYMGRYPVTQAQWRVVAGYEPVNRQLAADPACLKGDNCPVEYVSWEDAQEFCARLSRYTGRHYRLPTEAEWEYACRAGTTTPFSLGDSLNGEVARYSPPDQDDEMACAVDVGQFPANAWGLHDMHGTILEWCQDDWHDTYEGAPTDGRAWIVAERRAPKVLRGGSWDSLPVLCRSAYRFHSPSRRDYDFGFRVCVALMAREES